MTDTSVPAGDAAALALFNRYYQDTRNHVDAQARVWSDLIDAFLGEPNRAKPSGDDAWRSHVFIQYAWQQIQTLSAELAAEDDAAFVWEPRNPGQQAHAKVVESLTMYQFERDKYPEKRLLSVIMAAIFGYCPLKSSWAYEKVSRPIRNSAGQKQMIDVCLKDQPTAIIVDPRDFAYDLRGRTADEWRFAYHRMRLTLAEIEKPTRADGTPRYKNLDKLRQWYSGDQTTSFSETEQDHDNDYVAEIKKAREEGIEVVEMWTPDRLIVVAARQIVIRDEPNPYYHGRIPFDLVTLQPSFDGPAGHPVMRSIRDIQELLWTLDNASMDALKLSIDPPLIGDFDDDEDKGIYPGKLLRGRAGKDAVAPLRITGMEHFTSDTAIQSLETRMKKTTGITDEMAGQSQADSATQAAINQRQSKGRVAIMLRQVDAAWARVAEKFLQLNQQFLDVTKPHRITGKEGWKLIQPTEIAGMWDCRPKSSSERVVAELDRQNKLEALAAITPLSETITASGFAIDVAPVIRAAAEAFKLPVDEIVIPLDEKLQTNARIAAAEAIMQAQAAAMMAPQASAVPPMGGSAQGAGAAPPVEQSLEEEAANEPSPSTGRAAGQMAYDEAMAPQPEDIPAGA